MKCLKAKKLMPLYARGDLSARRMRSVGVHLDSCPSCRKDLEGYRKALAQVKAAAGAETTPDWNESEWRALMARAVGGARQVREKQDAVRGPIMKPRWAVAAGAAAAIVLAAVMLLQKEPGFRPGLVAMAPGAGDRSLEPIAAPVDQDVVSVTLVSQETGLQVFWFFNKNFEWKGDQE